MMFDVRTDLRQVCSHVLERMQCGFEKRVVMALTLLFVFFIPLAVAGLLG
jgi:hypothetical protein